MARPDASIAAGMQRLLVIVFCLACSVVAAGGDEAAFDEVDRLLRLRDYSAAVERLQALAQQGQVEAQFRLAGFYRSGKGVAANQEKARDLYHQAALAGHARAQFLLARLLEKSSDPATLTEARKWYRLAAGQGHAQAAERLEKLDQSAGAASPEISSEALFDAIRHNDEALIETLIARGANLDLVDAQGNTPVLAALLAGWPRLAVSLIPQSGYPGQPNASGIVPLQLASARGYIGGVAALLDRKVDIDEADALGNTALMAAIRNRRSQVVKLLLDRGADPNLLNDKKQSAIDIAVGFDDAEVKTLLERYGARAGKPAEAVTAYDLEGFKSAVNKSGTRYAGWPLLNVAVELGESRLVEQMLSRGYDLTAGDPDGNTALQAAARNGKVIELRQLLEHGANPDAGNRAGETALHLAVDSGCLKCVTELVRYRADPSIENKAGVTPLETAILAEQVELARLLLKGGGDYAGVHRALLIALQKKLDGLAIELVERDSRLSLADANGRTLLWHSADQGLAGTTAILVGLARIDLDRQDNNGHGAISRAIIGGHVEIVRLLTDSGADLTLRSATGNSLLMLAVLSGKAQSVELLLQRPIDVNAKNNSGNTALMLAAAGAQNRMVEKLIAAGSDLQLRNSEEMNAFQIATESGHPDTAQLIHNSSNLIFKLFN